MKKYISKATKPLLLVTLISCAIMALGIIFAIIQIQNLPLVIGLISMGGLLGVLFLICYLVEKSRALIIDSDRIILPRGVRFNGKAAIQKTVISASEIKSIGSSLFKGDGLISKDTKLYTLRLLDGTKVTITLYAYGEQAETEIVETIKAMLA